MFGGGRVGAAGDGAEPDAHFGAQRVVRARLVGEPQQGHGQVELPVRDVLVGGGAQDRQGPFRTGVPCGEELRGDRGVGRARRTGQQGGFAVQGRSVRRVRPVEYGGPRGRVAEPAPGGEQARGLQVRERPGRGALGGAGQPCEAGGGREVVEYGDRPGQFGRGGTAAVEAGEDGLGVAVAWPGLRVLEQGPQQQRVSAAGLVQPVGFRLGAVRRHRADGLGGEALQAQPREVGQPDQLGAQQRVVAVFVGGCGEHQQDAGLPGAAREVQQVAAGELVDVVQVVDEDGHRGGGAQCADGRGEGPHGLDPVRLVRRRRRGQRTGRGVGGQLAQDAQRMALFGGGADGAQNGSAAALGLSGGRFQEFGLSTADRTFDEQQPGIAGCASRKQRI